MIQQCLDHKKITSLGIFGVSGPWVPVLVVSTQLNKLVSSIYRELSAEEQQRPTEETYFLCGGISHPKFQKLCVDPLTGIDSNLRYRMCKII